MGLPCEASWFGLIEGDERVGGLWPPVRWRDLLVLAEVKAVLKKAHPSQSLVTYNEPLIAQKTSIRRCFTLLFDPNQCVFSKTMTDMLAEMPLTATTHELEWSALDA